MFFSGFVVLDYYIILKKNFQKLKKNFQKLTTEKNYGIINEYEKKHRR